MSTHRAKCLETTSRGTMIIVYNCTLYDIVYPGVMIYLLKLLKRAIIIWTHESNETTVMRLETQYSVGGLEVTKQHFLYTTENVSY